MAETSDTVDARFGEAAHGVRWALGQIPEARGGRRGWQLDRRRIEMVEPTQAAGDSYAVAWATDAVTVMATTALGAIGGLLAVARQVQAGRSRDATQELRFRTRFYKHEVTFEGPATAVRGAHAGPERAITRYTDQFCEALVQQIVARHFNAFTVYAGYHPFEWFLDYEGFEHGTDKPADLRRRNFEALARLLGAARKYGLRTFLHHYVSHFTQALGDHLQLGISEKGSRLAAYDHPMVEEYNRYIYRRTFEALPALDGLYMNFESSGDAIPFMRRTLLQVANGLPKRPVLFFRLWGVTDVEGMKGLLADYDGPKGLIHKSHDTNDVYYYPVADDRVKVWKRAIPGIEFAFSVGPCHNCGTNISQKLWTDPDYVHALLASVQAKGADSISYQSSRELLLPHLPDSGIFPRADHDHARMNIGHLEAVVDYVRGQKPSGLLFQKQRTGRQAARGTQSKTVSEAVSAKDWAGRYAAWFGVDERAGEPIRRAIVESSQIILKQYRQFCYGSAQEGYLYPGRFSHYQEPFFYYPMSFLNRIGEIPHNVGWRAWIVRRRKIKVVPDDTQAPIDFANPAVRRRPASNPTAMVKQIRRHIAAAQEAIERYRELAGQEHGPAAPAPRGPPGPWHPPAERLDNALIAAVQRNGMNGERIWREILIAIELGSCYFAGSRAAFFKHLHKARDLMRQTARVLGENLRDTDRFGSTTASGPFSPEQDAAQIDQILAHEKDDFPFQALRAYLGSHERYNEIRRLCRPYVSVRESMTKRNLALLRQSLAAADKAVSLLSDPRYALYRDNVMAWIEYVRAEIDWLTPPAMACPPDEAIGTDEGFRRMVHDQCYRWGERCWEDFASFFARRNFFGEDACDCRATRTPDGLTLSLREHGIDWSERKAAWDANRGTVNQNGFMRIFLDPGNAGRRILQYTVWFEGRGGTVSRFAERADGHIHSDKPTRLEGCPTRFRHTDSSWRFDITIPWKQLGGAPKKGDTWRLNMVSNPAVKRNRQVAWCQGYEYHLDVARLGYIVFV